MTCVCDGVADRRNALEIGKKLGPFDLSFLPIWRGGTLGFVSWLGLRVRLRVVTPD